MAALTFQDAEKIIRENPKQADALAFEYQQFLKNYPETPPEDYPESVKNGEVISETYGGLRDQYEDFQMRENGGVDRSVVPQDLMGVPLLAAAFLQKPKIMEDDGDYKKIKEKLQAEWLKKNPGKDLLSKDGLDYLYGSSDDKTKTSVNKEAEESFKNNPKFKKRVERYDKEAKKIYKNHENDPQWLAREHNRQTEINARLELLEINRDKKIKVSKEEIGKSQQEIIQRVNKKHQDKFTQEHPEKAKAYLERIQAREKREEEKKNKSSVRSSDIRKILNELRKSEMPPTQSSPPSRYPSFRQSFNKGIDQVQRGASNVARGGSKIASQAGKAASQAGKMAAQAAARGIMAFFATPPGWITLGVIIGILIIVFLIVFITGRDKKTTQQTTILEASPSATLLLVTPTEEELSICNREYYESPDCSGAPIASSKTNCQKNTLGCTSWGGSGSGVGTLNISSCTACSVSTPTPAGP